jgi:hypothetical protein
MYLQWAKPIIFSPQPMIVLNMTVDEVSPSIDDELDVDNSADNSLVEI